MVYSASSVSAQLNPRINSSFYYASHQLVWAVVSFIALMFFKRRDYRALQSAGVGLRIAGRGVVPADPGLLLRQQNASLVSSGRHRHAAAFRIRQTGADHFLLLLRHAQAGRHQQPAHHVRGLACAGGSGGLRRVGRFRHRHRAHRPGRHRFLCCRVAAQVRRRGAVLGSLFSIGFVVSKPYRMARVIGFFDPEYKHIAFFDPEGKIKKYVSRIA